ncbi:MAG: serine/threonine-protein phosphatase [Phycisphaerae bacterium]|nr:serine/threonine-protein phosphatase [Phycisphaerae bacterium]
MASGDERKATEITPAADALGWGEALLDAGTSIEAQLGPEAAARFERELYLFQRRRAFWYCIAVGFLVIAFLVFDLLDVLHADWTNSESLITLIAPGLDGVLAAMYAAAAVAIQRRAKTRQQVLAIFSWLLAAGGSVMVVAPAFLWSFVEAGDPTRETWEGAFIGGMSAITVVFLMHFLASLFVALSPREAVMPLVPITIAFVATVAFVYEGPVLLRMSLLVLWPIAGAPGVLWSTWRHRRFVSRFRWQTLGGRYRDMRADLRDARRVHESQFPAPILEGPVRMQFAYEPMRDVGGDYLFAHRKADGGLVVVIFDVSGHGVASALAASRLHSELDRLATDRPEMTADEAIVVLNKFAHRALAPQAIFASAIAIEIASDGSLRYVNAGHPPGLVRREDGTLRDLPATATLLGVLDAATFDTAGEVLALGPRDLVVASTDGVHEAPSPSGEFFGDDRFRALVTSGSAPERIPSAVLDAVRRHRDDEPADDVLVVAIWRNA